MQQSISKYFGMDEYDTLNLNRDHSAKWSVGGKSKNNILIKQLRKPILITITHSPEIELTPINKCVFNYSKHQLSIIKSNLQKAIRRNEVDNAINSAAHMMLADGGGIELLRRLCIIIIEDKLESIKELGDNYSTLVWIMTTETGFKGWRSWVLGIIKFICDKRHIKLDKIHSTIKTGTISWSDNEYSCSILLRRSYGGMNGDMDLLYSCSKYIKSFEIKSKIITPMRKYNKVLTIMPCAIDFHCDREMIRFLNNKTKLDKDLLKKLIWTYSSSIRYREELPNKNDDWDRIKYIILNYQNNIIYNYFNN